MTTRDINQRNFHDRHPPHQPYRCPIWVVKIRSRQKRASSFLTTAGSRRMLYIGPVSCATKSVQAFVKTLLAHKYNLGCKHVSRLGTLQENINFSFRRRLVATAGSVRHMQSTYCCACCRISTFIGGVKNDPSAVPKWSSTTKRSIPGGGGGCCHLLGGCKIYPSVLTFTDFLRPRGQR